VSQLPTEPHRPRGRHRRPGWLVRGQRHRPRPGYRPAGHHAVPGRGTQARPLL